MSESGGQVKFLPIYNKIVLRGHTGRGITTKFIICSDFLHKLFCLNSLQNGKACAIMITVISWIFSQVSGLICHILYE